MPTLEYFSNIVAFKKSKQQPNYLKGAVSTIIAITFKGVLYQVCAYTVTVYYPCST